MDIIYIQRPKIAFATCGQVGDTKIANLTTPIEDGAAVVYALCHDLARRSRKHCGVWRELMRVRLPPSGAAMSKDAKTHFRDHTMAARTT